MKVLGNNETNVKMENSVVGTLLTAFRVKTTED
jgi:hypothetical protein